MKIDDIKHTKCALIHENIVPVQIVYKLIFMLLKCIYFTHTNSLIQNVPMILLMNLQSTVHILITSLIY